MKYSFVWFLIILNGYVIKLNYILCKYYFINKEWNILSDISMHLKRLFNRVY